MFPHYYKYCYYIKWQGAWSQIISTIYGNEIKERERKEERRRSIYLRYISIDHTVMNFRNFCQIYEEMLIMINPTKPYQDIKEEHQNLHMNTVHQQIYEAAGYLEWWFPYYTAMRLPW